MITKKGLLRVIRNTLYLIGVMFTITSIILFSQVEIFGAISCLVVALVCLLMTYFVKLDDSIKYT
jgi:hypothetical protein